MSRCDVAQTRTVSVPMVAFENRPAVPVMEARDYKVPSRSTDSGDEVGLAKDAVWRR